MKYKPVLEVKGDVDDREPGAELLRCFQLFLNIDSKSMALSYIL